MISTEDILKNLLLQNNDDWGISKVTCDDESEEIHVTLKYLKESVLVDGTEYPILDFRHERNWRHLDLWQYKTLLEARIPRYRIGDKIKSIDVPWALPTSRMSWLMEKKTIETLLSTKNQTKTARLLRLTFDQVHGVMSRSVE